MARPVVKHPQLIVRLILLKSGKVLLLQRHKSKGGGYSLIGGRVELGETVVDALLRETLEESGIKIKRKHLDLVHIVNRKRGREAFLSIFFLTNKWKGKIVNKEPDKCERFEWFALSELPNSLTPNARAALQTIQKGGFYSEWNG